MTKSTRSVTKVKVVDGKIVIDEENMVIRAPERIDPDDLEIGEAKPEFINNATWSKRESSRRWSTEETMKFYSAIRKYGTDFLLLSKLFPNRSRNQIRRKFKREEKMNQCFIDFALSNRLPFGSYIITSLISSL